MAGAAGTLQNSGNVLGAANLDDGFYGGKVYAEIEAGCAYYGPESVFFQGLFYPAADFQVE